MARMIIVGGGAGGLLTALLLSADGHEITVLERDEESPPGDDEEAWEHWQRSGVTQLRQPHVFLGRIRQVLMNELPALWTKVEEVGAHIDWRDFSPDPSAPPVPGDALLRAEGIRRTTFERLLAEEVASRTNIEVRRGSPVAGPVAGPSARKGVVHVAGVVTESGERLHGDLVVDAAGRRTPTPRWLRRMGAEVTEFEESDGFAYFTRWFRIDGGPLPTLDRGLLGGLIPSLRALLFPADAGVFAVAMVGSARDRVLRRLRDPEAFMRVARSLPTVAKWVDCRGARPITEVKPMGSIRNRHLRLWHQGRPAATGIVNIADSATSTNPSLGRGVSIAADYALELREVMRSTEGPLSLVTAFDEAQERRLTPWLHDAIESDRTRRRGLEAMLDGNEAAEPPTTRQLVEGAAQIDVECWRAWSRVGHVLALPETVLGDPELVERAATVAAEVPPPTADLDRDGLLAAIA